MKKLLAVVAATGLIATMMGSASASIPTKSMQRDTSDGVVDSPVEAQELPTPPGGLPASRSNMKLVSRLQLTESPEIISDVSYHRGFAYLGEWFAACDEGDAGYDAEIHVVNMRNPKNPREVATIPLTGEDWTGEGVDLITHRGRDLLLLSSEPCDSNVDGAWGGIHIYDVTDPRNPVELARNFGDKTIGDIDGEVEERESAHSNHSVMGWVDGRRAFAVTVDNEEFPDVDIFDITDPENPVVISETGVTEWDTISDQVANGAQIFHHDMQVKRVGGEWHMLVSYWDVGWVLLNVENPAEPVFVTDSDYPDPDPLTGFSLPEGNAHQAWWSADNEFIVSTDEDFSPDRIQTLSITTGPNAGDFAAVAVGGAASPGSLPDGVLNGPTVYGGYACPATDSAPGSAAVPQRDDFDLELEPGEEAIIVLQRGPSSDPSATEEACFPGQKAETALAAGWDTVLFVNHHPGEVAAPDGPPFCGSGGFPATPPIPSACTTHTAFHHIFNVAPNLDVPYNPALEPQIGDVGERVSVEADFDGWGYVHLLDGSSLEEIDAYAVDEALDPRFASGFGDLSVHEVKTDWRRSKHLGYIAYYSAGARVVKFGPNGIREVGHFIDERGNNFWGVWPIRNGKKRPLLLFSDRDFGLYVLKYTGPQ